ncbi:MAG TPA: HAMP domain-containing sensor histidine kinase [Bacillota bacterium]|nr:HAMP domain-containing sensor histidine kinase [Bacillota bacterium]
MTGALLLFVNMAVAMAKPTLPLQPQAEVPWELVDIRYDQAGGECLRSFRAMQALPGALREPAQPLPEVPIPLIFVSVVRQDVFNQLRVVSLMGLGVIVVVGGIGSYWLAGRALRPVRHLAQAAQQIGPRTLDTRLNLRRPDDELNQLAGAFDGMLDRLEAAFDRQGRFVADAAHELRTPLATLRAGLDAVRGAPDTAIELHRTTTAALERALTRLQRLADDLLLLATEEPCICRSVVDIQPIMEDVLLDLKPLADEHSVTLSFAGNGDLMTPGDSLSLARVFRNLVENGIRYNRQAGEVIVNTCREGEWLVVTVADTGIGIPVEQQPRIFDRFYRADSSRSRHGGGVGLGLSIAMHVVQLHGGQLEVKSTPGAGSTFIVKLPLPKATEG